MAAAKFDAEDLLDLILSVMTNGGALNTKIAAVDAEKITAGKGFTPALATIKAGAYYEQTWDAKMLNNTPSIFYGIEDVQAVEGGGALAKTYKCFVEVVLVDSGQTNDASRRISRYARALEELFLGNFKPALAIGTFKIDSVRPMAFKLEMDSSDEIKVGGISFAITLA